MCVGQRLDQGAEDARDQRADRRRGEDLRHPVRPDEERTSRRRPPAPPPPGRAPPSAVRPRGSAAGACPGSWRRRAAGSTGASCAGCRGPRTSARSAASGAAPGSSRRTCGSPAARRWPARRRPRPRRAAPRHTSTPAAGAPQRQHGQPDRGDAGDWRGRRDEPELVPDLDRGEHDAGHRRHPPAFWGAVEEQEQGEDRHRRARVVGFLEEDLGAAEHARRRTIAPATSARTRPSRPFAWPLAGIAASSTVSV